MGCMIVSAVQLGQKEEEAYGLNEWTKKTKIKEIIKPLKESK